MRSWLTGERRLALIALVVAAGLLVVSFAVPALGGPNLKKLIKKEVSRQLADRTSPQGPAGPAGPAGSAGARGAPGAQGPGAERLNYLQSETDNQVRSVGTVDELTVLAKCMQVSGRAHLTVYLQSSAAGWVVAGSDGESNNGLTVAPQPPISSAVAVAPASTTILDFEPNADTDSKQSFVQATVYKSGIRVVSLQLYSLATDSGNFCSVRGIAVPTS